MPKKFASLHLVESLDEVPVKFGPFKKAPPLFRDWYIDKFNPYRTEEIKIMDEEGYAVYLPFRVSDAYADHERAQSLARRALQDLKASDVEILLPFKDCPFTLPKDLPIADGRSLFPYFIMEAIEKVLKILGVNLKNAEIIILAEDPLLTQNLLYNIYPHVNFLSVMTDRGDEDIRRYRQWADFIFSETGLNLSVSEKNKTLLAEAHIVVNTGAAGQGLDYSYKKGAVYFDLGDDKRPTLTLAGIREDLLIIDGLKLRFDDCGLLLPQAEAALYVKSKIYRTLSRRGFTAELAKGTERELEKLSLRLSQVCFREHPLDNLYFAKRQAVQNR